MVEFVLAGGERACEALAFPSVGWWILHVLAIVAVFAIGCVCGKKCGAKRAAAPEQPSPAAPSEPAAPDESSEAGEGEGGEGV